MRDDFRSIPFWSLNDRLEDGELREQINRMHEDGIGGFILHARGGLKTEYMSEEWLRCMSVCASEAKRLGMQAWLYDENGWPSGFAGGKLIETEETRDRYFLYSFGKFDESADYHYDIGGEILVRREKCGEGECWLNVFEKSGVATADICNKSVVDRFIGLTHQRYKEYFGENFSDEISGFFTDEPQYYRWHTPFSIALKDYFREHYGEDVYERLGLLFTEKEGYREYRWKYWKGMQTLMLTNFSENIYGWCRANGVKLTGHYIDEKSLSGQMRCCAGIMPFYAAMDIPGMDWLGRHIGTQVAAKQVASVAAQTGKKQVVTESFACCGWDVTPRELKYIADFQYLDGVNLLCQHLLPYSEVGQRKRDHPNHYGSLTPWVGAAFRQFNDYFTALGERLGESREDVRIAVLQPVTSAYLYYKREDGADGYGIGELENSFQTLTKTLSENHLAFHFIDETLLKRYGRAENGRLRVGDCIYDVIIFSACYNLDSFTDRLFAEYAKGGGKFLLTEGAPAYLEGVRHEFTYLKSNITLEQILREQFFTIENGSLVRVSLRNADGRKMLFAMNTSPTESVDCRVHCKEYSSFTETDLLTEKERNVSFELHFEPMQSRLLTFSDEKPASETQKNVILLRGPFEVTERDDNYLTLDRCRFSTDGGKTYSDEIQTMGVFQELLKMRYRGDVFLKFSFEARKKPDRLFLLCENTNLESIKINGMEVLPCGRWELEKRVLKADIAACTKTGKNEIEIKLDFYEKDGVYYALFGEGVTEGLKNCLTYDTTIEDIWLQGDFGCYSDSMRKGGMEGVLVSDGGFYLDERRTALSDPVSEGEPFFAGRMTFSGRVVVAEGQGILKIEGRFHYAEISVNGKRAGTLLFGDSLDISDFLEKGENEISVTLYTSARNLLGPHHVKDNEEPLSVNPDTFEQFGSWNHGKSGRLVGEYRFVRWGIEK